MIKIKINYKIFISFIILLSIQVKPLVSQNIINFSYDVNGNMTKKDIINNNPACLPQLNARVFLNHVSTSTLLMDNYLASLSSFPLSDPYAAAPLNANFSHVNSGATASITPAVLATAGNDAIIDWLFLEFRQGQSGSSTVAYTKAALLQRDGDIVGMDGQSPLRLSNVPAGNYYITVRHRNHLGFRTAAPVAISLTTPALNFTNGSVALYGISPLITLNANIAAMNGGDANFDGSADSVDSAIWETQNGGFDNYWDNADYSLDGSVDATDSAIWEINNGKYQELE